jgi:hypothetical protein
MPSSPTQRAVFSYLSPLPSTQNPKAYEILPSAFPLFPPSYPHTNLVFSDKICEIEDIRGKEDGFELDVQGFRVLRHVSEVDDLKDKTEIEEKYLPELEELVRRELGGEVKKVHIFGWKVC